MSNNLKNLKFGLLFFKNNDEKENFILKINNTIKKQKYKNNLLYEGCLIENKENFFTKITYAYWNKKIIIKISDNNDLIETKKYRITFNSIKYNVYYFEKNGAINCIDNVINKDFNFVNFEKKLWNNIVDTNKNHNENVIDYINKYVENEYKQDFEKTNITCNNLININIDNFNYDYFNFYNLFNDIKEINNEFKLPPYNKIECIDNNNKQSETIYNKLVFENNSDNYLLLDRKIIDGCEVADLYDIKNKLLFHNKKIGDLRILSLQIIIGALIMKNKEKSQEYFTYLIKSGINDKIDENFKYVIGLIGNNKKIAQKDKISLGIVNYILKKHNINLYIDFIDVI